MKRTLKKASVALSLLTLSLASQAQGHQIDRACQLEVERVHEITLDELVDKEEDAIHPLFRAPHEKRSFGSAVRNTGAYMNARGGTDLITHVGMGVRSMTNATVKSVGHFYMGSMFITAETENGKTLRYGFLRNVPVRAGDEIKKGQLLGTVSGNTYRGLPDRGRLRIEIFENSTNGNLTVRKPCINRRADVLNPDFLLKTLEVRDLK